MLAHLLLERLHRRPLPRVPERAALMNAPEQIDAFDLSGHGEGILIHLYALNAIYAQPLIRPGDTVLDLACGPANQLAYFARLNPLSHFIGLDAAPGMLAIASQELEQAGIANVDLQQGDISRLDDFATASIDCVTCTMSLHHLPDQAALSQTMREIGRVLKPDGAVFLVDFGRLKRRATLSYFAADRHELQSERFTRDFLDSMRAAFSIDELRVALAQLGRPIRIVATAFAPFMVVVHSAARRALDGAAIALARNAYRQLSAGQRRDFDNMVRWYRASGLPLPCRID
jgi:SAM-dependent methyltransferase